MARHKGNYWRQSGSTILSKHCWHNNFFFFAGQQVNIREWGHWTSVPLFLSRYINYMSKVIPESWLECLTGSRCPRLHPMRQGVWWKTGNPTFFARLSLRTGSWKGLSSHHLATNQGRRVRRHSIQSIYMAVHFFENNNTKKKNLDHKRRMEAGFWSVWIRSALGSHSYGRSKVSDRLQHQRAGH